MFKLLEYEQLNSTNKFALDNLMSLEANTVIRAQTQTSGRGRFDRKWISDKRDNCYLSFLLKPNSTFHTHFANFTQYLSIILAETLEDYAVKPEIKWPNDVLLKGKKIAGILSEISFSEGKLNGIVLGIGVNLNLAKEDLQEINIPATSLNIELSQKINANEFVNNLIRNFYKDYDLFLEKGFSAFRAKYLSYANFIGKDIIIKNPELQILGVGLDVKNDGTLEVLTPSGDIKNIISGDVTFLD